VTPLARAVAAAGRRLAAIYRLDLDLRAEQFVISPQTARRWLPGPRPRTGLVVVDDPEGARVGLYVDPRDRADAGAILEETSHLVCLAWHAARGLRVSRLVLELQAEVDRFAVARLRGGDGLAHFAGFRWADWMDAATRHRYETAQRAAQRYCRGLARRFPQRRDTPGLLRELRRFYRASPEAKLRSA
jgi:hypothetical protein